MIDQQIIDAIADAVVERLREDNQPPPSRLLTVEEVARRYGVSTDTVYRNASRWGGIKVGDGPRAPWRFDPDRIAEALTPEPAVRNKGTFPRRRRRAADTSPVELLPIRGRKS